VLAEWPEHGFLGEESPPLAPEAEYVWVVDPIDGTSNFGRGLPVHAVSVACLRRGNPVVAAVHCFPEDITYHAALGRGAYRGGARFALHGRRLDEAAILGLQWHRSARSLPYLGELLSTGSRIRNLGCTVVQLCEVALGRLDGNVQEHGRVWDFAAAALIVTEAGGLFTTWRGEAIFPVADLANAGHLPSLAAHPQVHGHLRRLLSPWQDQLDSVRGV
jgi:myo-inositol-1(or 4)-monophosphatase